MVPNDIITVFWHCGIVLIDMQAEAFSRVRHSQE